MVVTGKGALAGGILVSAGNALLFVAVLWGRAGRRFGARRVIALAFAATAAALLAAGFCGGQWPLATAGFLLVGAGFIIAVDALGSTVFMRAVHAYERPQMTAVYRTYLDLSELTPPLAYSIVLAFFGLGGVFATLGVFVGLCAWATLRFLPRRL